MNVYVISLIHKIQVKPYLNKYITNTYGRVSPMWRQFINLETDVVDHHLCNKIHCFNPVVLVHD